MIPVLKSSCAEIAPIAQAVAAHRTPLFIYDLTEITERVLELATSAVDTTSVFYSIKANPFGPVVRKLVAARFSMEVASAAHMDVALAAGCSASDILLVGPSKDERLFEHAVNRAVGTISIEAVSELKDLLKFSTRNRPRLAVRVNPNKAFGIGRLQTGGCPSQFGIDEELLPDAIEHARNNGLEVSSLHVYVGSQVRSLDQLMSNFANACRILERTRRLHSTSDLIFGPGLSVDYDTFELTACFGKVIATMRDEAEACGFHLKTEIGRAMVADAGVLVCNVVRVKESKGRNFVLLDGGISHLFAAAGMGGFRPTPFPMVHVAASVRPTGIYSICGPLCTPLDRLATNVQMAGVAEGDLILLLKAGAYGPTASLSQFLGVRSAEEVGLCRGFIRQIVSKVSESSE